MDWFANIDAYCERTGPEYWSEPVNAVTNLAFLIAAFVMWRRLGPDAPKAARILAVVLGLIGIGSYLFHTHAQVWAAMADVLPIVGFILVYLFAVNRYVLGLKRWVSLGLTIAFVPFAAATIPLFSHVPGMGSSASYGPVPLLILIYAGFMWRTHPYMARGMVIGALILIVSIVMRSVDMSVCARWPVGTHFLWHILNAVMLGWMIEVYRRHGAPSPDNLR